MTTAYAEINGRPADAENLRIPALTGAYGHFTAMQVRGGRVRGLALHLARLDAATRELFGPPRRRAGPRAGPTGPQSDRRRGRGGARLRVRAGRGPQRHGDRTAAAGHVAGAAAPALRAVRAAGRPRQAPRRLRPGLLRPGRRPRGYTEALLTGPGGEIAEGAITNIAFWDGSSVVWPDRPALLGTTMALVESRLPGYGTATVRRPVTLGGLGAYRAAFVTNSQGIAPVAGIDDTAFAVDAELMETVWRLYAEVPWDAV
ncbi:aminotransferase class IV [Streptomyces sp. BPTC-684]|uniref:aminotransferase class IV n=1 Tax=Streptomyces sp. BPTC-684 TaxID=3043734 RepID=UPI0032C23439